MGMERDLNPHAHDRNKILSLECLPIPPSVLTFTTHMIICWSLLLLSFGELFLDVSILRNGTEHDYLCELALWPQHRPIGECYSVSLKLFTVL